jgi:pyruvate dehydrogenase E2 component (dihydrolipoamide acetyltransferase)
LIDLGGITVARAKDVLLPDIGDFKDVDVIEVLVRPGDRVAKEDSLVTLESDKATMEVPSPSAGRVSDVRVKVGDKVSMGDLILRLEADEGEAEQAAPASEPPPSETASAEAPAPQPTTAEPIPRPSRAVEATPAAEPERPSTDVRPPPITTAAIDEQAFTRAHASPSVRRFARELGVDLGRVQGSGPKNRILKEDVQHYVKGALARPHEAPAAPGVGLPSMPEIDFSRFGEIETRPLTKIQRLSAGNLHRNWLTVPHVTQFDEADITELEAFRTAQAAQLKDQGIRLSLLAFLLKACAAALRAYPSFNASLHPDGEQLIVKKYVHVGVAVDTTDGLVVPVIRDVDQKGVLDLARELGEISAKARAKKLTPAEMQGGCFTVSSLGGIGGTAFTPIVNAPEVAILGVSRAVMKPVYRNEGFEPRLMLPLSLSYDHRVIDGAVAARFIVHLSGVLTDIRRVLL